MANQRVTDLDAITALPDSGIIHVIDTTVTTQNAAGSSFKITKANLLKENTAAILLNTAKVGITPTQSTAITNNTGKVGYTDALVAASPSIITKLFPAKNLFNRNSTTTGAVANDGTFNLITNTSFLKSEYIAVKAGEVYTFSGFGSFPKSVQFSDALKVKLITNSGVTLSASVSSITIPVGCLFIIFTVKNSDETVIPASFQIELGSTATTYAAYVLVVVGKDSAIRADALSLGSKIGDNLIVTNNLISVFPKYAKLFNKVGVSGTSITFGVGATGGNTGTNKWTYLFTQTLNSVLGRTITLVDGGVSGATSAGMLTALPALITQAPQIFLLEISINDTKIDGQGLTVAQTESNYRSMITLCRNANIVPVLFNCWPLDVSIVTNTSQSKRTDICNVSRKLSTELSVQLIDIDSVCAQNATLLGDGVHPNDRGHLFGANIISGGIIRNGTL